MITLEVLNLTSWGTKSQLQHYDSFLVHVLISLIRLNPKNPSKDSKILSLPKEARQPLLLTKNPRKINIDSLPLNSPMFLDSC